MTIAKSYTIKELIELKAEYLSTLGRDLDEWYTSDREMQADALTGFFGWLNIKENTPI